MPIPVRLRVAALTVVQTLANHHPGWLASVRDALPPPVSTFVRRLFGPVRIPQPPAAWVPLDSIPETNGQLRPLPARTSVVIPVFGGRDHLRLCLGSLRAWGGSGLEVVVADDGSDGGTRDLLDSVARSWPELKILRSNETRGFASAVNRGAAAASGEVLVLLNSDVVVTPGALERLVGAVASGERNGIVSAVTNDSGDEATVPAAYRTLDDLLGLASQRARACGEALRDVRKAALFCAAIRRSVFAEVGGLDEGYGRGMFEDDDLARGLGHLGYRVCIAPGAYVHHYAGASFRALPPAVYLEIFERSRLRFQRKWADPVRYRGASPTPLDPEPP